jgi:ArsR family transcriptional regulator, arsenate/arsenite/antimonite-responsive transcriptional repressor
MDTMTASRSARMRTSGPDESCCGGEVSVVPSLDAAQTSTLADRLKALSDPTRLRMLDLLVQQPQTLCVCDITSQFDLHQPTISHHLRILREAGLIQGDKRGVWMYYGATDAGKRSLSLVRGLL